MVVKQQEVGCPGLEALEDNEPGTAPFLSRGDAESVVCPVYLLLSSSLPIHSWATPVLCSLVRPRGGMRDEGNTGEQGQSLPAAMGLARTLTVEVGPSPSQ